MDAVHKPDGCARTQQLELQEEQQERENRQTQIASRFCGIWFIRGRRASYPTLQYPSVRSEMSLAACVCLLALLIAAFAGAATISGGSSAEPCQPDKLTVYKVVLHTFWSRDKFPKHYPDWRPPAQWSKVFGEFFENVRNETCCLWLELLKNRYSI